MYGHAYKCWSKPALGLAIQVSLVKAIVKLGTESRGHCLIIGSMEAKHYFPGYPKLKTEKGVWPEDYWCGSRGDRRKLRDCRYCNSR
jgi:hypothetical protein